MVAPSGELIIKMNLIVTKSSLQYAYKETYFTQLHL